MEIKLLTDSCKFPYRANDFPVHRVFERVDKPGMYSLLWIGLKTREQLITSMSHATITPLATSDLASWHCRSKCSQLVKTIDFFSPGQPLHIIHTINRSKKWSHMELKWLKMNKMKLLIMMDNRWYQHILSININT